MMQWPRCFNGPTSSEQQYKVYRRFNRSCRSQSRICALVCVSASRRSCCRTEQLSVCRQHLPHFQQTVPVSLSSILSPICQPAFHSPSAPHFSSVELLWSFCLSLVPSQPGSTPPLPPCTGLSAPGLRTCIIPINSHRTGMIYSSLTDGPTAEPGWTDHTHTHTHTHRKHSYKSQVLSLCSHFFCGNKI